MAVCLALPGCSTPLGLSAFKKRDDEKLREMASIEGTRGPLERLLFSRNRERSEADGSLSPAEGLEEYEAAQKVASDGKFKQAEKAYKKIAKKYGESPVAEDALFARAESLFERKRYAPAQDAYAELIKHFPSTRYLDQASERTFSIAQIWLQSPTIVASGDIQQVNFDDPSATPPPKDPETKPRGITRRIPILPNLWDRSRPTFDTEGRAVESLRSIWMNDPTGSLADDALMLAASHSLRKGDYSEADHLFTILREDYPKSPHFEDAFVFGSHVKLMSYQGSSYDPKSLESARQLKESTLRLFPDHRDRERFLDEVRKIDEAKAGQIWADVRFYQQKRKPKAVAVTCRQLIAEYPNSAHAARARQVLADIEKTTNSKPSAPIDQPADADVYDEAPEPEVEPEEQPRRLRWYWPFGKARSVKAQPADKSTGRVRL